MAAGGEKRKFTDGKVHGDGKIGVNWKYWLIFEKSTEKVDSFWKSQLKKWVDMMRSDFFRVAGKSEVNWKCWLISEKSTEKVNLFYKSQLKIWVDYIYEAGF